MPRRLVILLAAATGIAVANLYYAQPLLDAVASSLGVSSGTAALIVTLSQLGYAAGLLLIVPLGDLRERRSLVVVLGLASVIALGVAAAAPSLVVLGVAMGIVGVTSCVAQVLVPLASELAAEDERGRVVGAVMSGLLLGILAARTASGLLAGATDWRVVYAGAAVLMLGSSVALWRQLPVSHGRSDMAYGPLVRSVGTLVATEPILRRRMVYGACGMFGFTAFWTALTLLLSGPSYGYGESTIGLFGLLGIAGAAAAQLSGRLVDGGRLHGASGAFLTCVLCSWLPLSFASHSLAALVVGIVLLDLGIQGAHIANQNAIYAAVPGARSRVTTAYMTGNFLFGAVGSAAAAALYDSGGWGAVCGACAGAAGVALLAWAVDVLVIERRADRAPGLEGRPPGADAA